MSKELTHRYIQGLKPRRRPFQVSDSQVPGLALRVLTSGSKRWSFRYRIGSSSRRVSLGSFSEVGLAAARDLAREKLRAVRKGGDPSRERREQRDPPSVKEVSDRFLEQHVKAKRKPSTYDSYESLLRLHILPRLGKHSIADVSRAEVGDLHHQMRTTPTQANRALAVLSKMFNLAERWGLRPDNSNPCRHIDRYPERSKERFLSPAEMGRLGEVLREVEAKNSEHPSAVLAIRLLALTGMRKSEVLNLRWSEIDFERGLALLPDSKTGKKAVLLPAPALELLSHAKRLESNPYVCWGRNKRQQLVGLQYPWSRIRSRAKLEDVRLHDLRHSHAATGAGLGLGLPIIGKLLGHTQPQTTARYAHLADDPLREAAERVGGEIAAALRGDEAEIVDLEQTG